MHPHSSIPPRRLVTIAPVCGLLLLIALLVACAGHRASAGSAVPVVWHGMPLPPGVHEDAAGPGQGVYVVNQQADQVADWFRDHWRAAGYVKNGYAVVDDPAINRWSAENRTGVRFQSNADSWIRRADYVPGPAYTGDFALALAPVAGFPDQTRIVVQQRR